MNIRALEFIIDPFTSVENIENTACAEKTIALRSRQLSEFIQLNDSFYQKVWVKSGQTQVLCSVFIQGGAKYVPEHAKQKNQGWLTAEYQMLPHATHTRQKREARGQISGRSQEIQRLIGRSLRAALDLSAMNGLNVIVDCDVLQADGGTRTTAINGSFLALALAFKKLSQHFNAPELFTDIVKKQIAAISVGILEDTASHLDIDLLNNNNNNVKYILDLNYEQDSQALVDANVVLALDWQQNDAYEIVEIQASAEGRTFSFAQLQKIIELAQIGIAQIQMQQNHIYAAQK